MKQEWFSLTGKHTAFKAYSCPKKDFVAQAFTLLMSVHHTHHHALDILSFLSGCPRTLQGVEEKESSTSPKTHVFPINKYQTDKKSTFFT